jgi:hypothetical protein
MEPARTPRSPCAAEGGEALGKSNREGAMNRALTGMAAVA